MKPLKKVRKNTFKKVKEKVDRFKDHIFSRQVVSKNAKFKISIERDSKNKKIVYVDKLIVEKGIKITSNQFTELILQVVEFAKKNKAESIKTHTWIFVKYPNIKEKLGFKSTNQKEYNLFLKRLKENGIDNIVDIYGVSYGQYYLSGNYYYLKYTSKKDPKKIKVIGSSKLGNFPLFEKKI
jgi:hypothetical protein